MALTRDEVRALSEARRDELEREAKALAAELASLGAVEVWAFGSFARGDLEVIGYSVERLLRRAVAYDPALSALDRDIPALDIHFIPTRYPNGLAESIPARVHTRPIAEEALRLARLTLGAVERAAFPAP